MEYLLEHTGLRISILVGTGLFLGMMNTLAGGGSLLSIPLLLTLGLPPISANATNRIPVFLQSGVASLKYLIGRRKRLRGLPQQIIPVAVGAFAGSMLALELPERLLQRILLAIIIFVSLTLLLEGRTPLRYVFARRRPNPPPTVVVSVLLGLLGFYGGFIQVGAGLLIFPILRVLFGYDYADANVVKVYFLFAITLMAILVFGAIFGQHQLILWEYGLLLGAGSAVGGYVGAFITMGPVGKTITRYSLIAVVLVTVIRLLVVQGG